MNESPKIGVNIDIGDVISGFSASFAKFKNNKTYNEQAYRELLEEYSKAMGVIEQLKQKIEELQRNKLPSKEEVESMSAMLDVMNKLDPETIDKINKLGGKK